MFDAFFPQKIYLYREISTLRLEVEGAMMCEGKFVFPLFASFLILTAFASVSEAKTIYVPDDYARIQWAVDNASAGDTRYSVYRYKQTI